MTTDADCLFCNIIADRIPSTRVHEDDDLVAFLDINPAAPVHVLVVPRDHYRNVAEAQAVAPDLVSKVVSAAIGVADKQGVADGWRLVFNTGERGGQTVFHVHAHVLGWPETQQ